MRCSLGRRDCWGFIKNFQKLRLFKVVDQRRNILKDLWLYIRNGHFNFTQEWHSMTWWYNYIISSSSLWQYVNLSCNHYFQLAKCESLGSKARTRNYLTKLRDDERNRYLVGAILLHFACLHAMEIMTFLLFQMYLREMYTASKNLSLYQY